MRTMRPCAGTTPTVPGKPLGERDFAPVGRKGQFLATRTKKEPLLAERLLSRGNLTWLVVGR